MGVAKVRNANQGCVISPCTPLSLYIRRGARKNRPLLVTARDSKIKKKIHKKRRYFTSGLCLSRLADLMSFDVCLRLKRSR